MKNRIISLFVYLLPGLIYAQNNADDKYEILSLTDMFSLFKDSKIVFLKIMTKYMFPVTSMSLPLCILHL